MSQHQASQDPMQLPVGATAEPRSCGTCKYFERLNDRWNNDWMGYCNIRLPPWAAEQEYNPESKPPKLLRDDNGCDLHKPDGKAYVVSKLMRP